MSAHTAGPWYWHTDHSGRVSLRTPDRGNLIVMDMARKGMQGAAPRFAMWGDMDAGQPRGRTGGILVDDLVDTHPDARLIAAAPELLEALKLIAHATSPAPDDGGFHEAAYDIANAAIAKAESA